MAAMTRQSHTNIHPARESKGMADKTKTQTKLNGWAVQFGAFRTGRFCHAPTKGREPEPGRDSAESHTLRP